MRALLIYLRPLHQSTPHKLANFYPVIYLLNKITSDAFETRMTTNRYLLSMRAFIAYNSVVTRWSKDTRRIVTVGYCEWQSRVGYYKYREYNFVEWWKKIIVWMRVSFLCWKIVKTFIVRNACSTLKLSGGGCCRSVTTTTVVHGQHKCSPRNTRRCFIFFLSSPFRITKLPSWVVCVYVHAIIYEYIYFLRFKKVSYLLYNM